MAEIISFPLPSGPNFNIPDVGEINWGQAVTDFLVAIPNGVPPTAGTFDLTGDLSFGASFGLVTAYFKSISPNIATVGSFRLAHDDAIAFRNFANTGDLLLSVDASDNILFNGATFGISGAINPGTANQLGYYATSSDAISGLPLITGNRALISDSSGLPVASTVTSTTLAFLDATSSVQTQINAVVATANAALPKSGGTMTGAIAMGGNKITGLADGTVATDAATFGQVASVAAFQAGDMKAVAYSTTPSGWLLCDGTSYATAAQPALFAAIGYAYGGSGANFNVPNTTNNVLAGAGSIVALGATAGSQTHVISSAELPTHTHTITDPGHLHGLHFATVVSAGATGSIPYLSGATGGNTVSATTGITVNNAGSSTAMSLVQPTIGVRWLIKT